MQEITVVTNTFGPVSGDQRILESNDDYDVIKKSDGTIEGNYFAGFEETFFKITLTGTDPSQKFSLYEKKMFDSKCEETISSFVLYANSAGILEFGRTLSAGTYLHLYSNK